MGRDGIEGRRSEVDSRPVLTLTDLVVAFGRPGREIRPVNGLSLRMDARECLVVLGESGSGKSLTALAAMRLEPPESRVTGSIRYEPADLELVGARDRLIRSVRGGAIGMIFQEPMTALNPVLRCGEQIAEAVRLHDPQRATRARTDTRVRELLEEVGLDEPERIAAQYPHELSGGMRQRVLTAIALAGDPSLLIADEPTTALDVVTETRILDLLLDLRDTRNLAILFITHDWGVAARIADRVAVLYAGRVVESGPAATVLRNPAHPYTRALRDAVPQFGSGAKAPVPIEGQVPDPAALPSGCSFHPRCSRVVAACRVREPGLRPFSEREHLVRCDVVNRVSS